MPLLKREPDLFPQDLFGLEVERPPWWVAHVKSRQEKALARRLRPLGVSYYLPQLELKTRKAPRLKITKEPWRRDA
jgi:hypothetical protein